MKNIVNFEMSVASRALVEQIRQLDASGAMAELKGSAVAEDRLAQALGVSEARVASSLKFKAMTIAAGDLLLLGASSKQACVVRAVASADDAFFVLAEALRQVSSGLGHSCWKLEVRTRTRKKSAKARWEKIAPFWRLLGGFEGRARGLPARPVRGGVALLLDRAVAGRVPRVALDCMSGGSIGRNLRRPERYGKST